MASFSPASSWTTDKGCCTSPISQPARKVTCGGNVTSVPERPPPYVTGPRQRARRRRRWLWRLFWVCLFAACVAYVYDTVRPLW